MIQTAEGETVMVVLGFGILQVLHIRHLSAQAT